MGKKQTSKREPRALPEYICGSCGVKRINFRGRAGRIGGIKKIYCPICKETTEHERIF